MSRIAVATCSDLTIDVDTPQTLGALRNAGIETDFCVWDDPSVDWDSYDLTVLRSTWDYAPRRNEFLQWARSVPRLLNPYEVVEYSTDKHYLADIEKNGFRIIPSTFCDVGNTPVFPDGNFIVKPCVGAGSIGADKFTAVEHDRARQHVGALHAQGRDVLIQPYIESIDTLGERALVFIDGEFSHAMTKGAMLNVEPDDRDMIFRREQMSLAEGEPDAVELAKDVLSRLGFSDLLYARVDLVLAPQGWSLMELELVEPSLFITFKPEAANQLAQAVLRRLS